MYLSIYLNDEQEADYHEMIDYWLTKDTFSYDCCGHWMRGVHLTEDGCWLVCLEDCEAPNDDLAIDILHSLNDPTNPTNLPDGYYLWTKADAKKGVALGIARYGVYDWLDGTSSDARTVSQIIQMALLGAIIYR